MTGGRSSGCGWAPPETTEPLGFRIDRALKDVRKCDVAPDLMRDDGGSRVRLRVTSLPHISHINPAWRAVISDIDDSYSRIADHSSYHEC